MKRCWLFLLLWCLPNWLSAHEVLDNFLQGLRTLQAQFQQNIYNEQGKLLELPQSGKMSMQRPNQFRWEYLHPYNQLIVADGEKVWILDNGLEQVTVKNLDNTLGKTPAFLLSRERKIEEDFFINQLPSQTQLTRLELVPKDEQAQFDSMRINLNGKILLGLELVDNLGQTTHITFSEVTRNPNLEKELFIFTPPAGADIFEEK